MESNTTQQATPRYSGPQAGLETIIVSIPCTDTPWITGATVVKRDSIGTPIIVRTASGTLHSRFWIL